MSNENKVAKPRISSIIQVASEITGIPVETIVGPSRKRMVGRVRAAVIYVARQYSEGRYFDQRYSFPRIAQILNRDHSSILHAFYSFDAYCDETPWLRELAEKLKQRVDGDPTDKESDDQVGAEQQRAKEEEMLAREIHDAIPSYTGRAKNDFRPDKREDGDDGHRALLRVAEGSRLLLEAIRKARGLDEGKADTSA
jgi:hypothetical protein